MTDSKTPWLGSTPWQGDACSLVDAFRSGERSPVEELSAVYQAIEADELNSFSYLAPEQALAAAQQADVSLPFGGVPMGVKELDSVAGWPP
jgi:Asp-tRNA(Asn)/Glu-tRNA(Gln) amidotransferase A subunit family amidase